MIEHTLNLANALVMRVETRYLNNLRKKADSTTAGSQKALDDLIKEVQRVNPQGKVDEEEVIIGGLRNSGVGSHKGS